MDTDSASRLHGSAELHAVLSLILDQVDPDAVGFEYRLVGTAAALAQGVRLPVGDVDILVAHRGDIDRAATALHGFPCLDPPVWLPDARQYFARFVVEQVKVEVSTVEWPTDADTFECIGRGPWEHYVRMKVGKHIVPAVGLELRLASELVRDRRDRYVPLIEHMRSHGANLQLVQKALHARGLDPARQTRVLAQLQHQ
ncbi:MAG: hypothetical protein WBH47_01390 [Streptosporangiaceae bacterium]